MAALAKHDKKRQDVIVEDGVFEHWTGRGSAALMIELQRHRSGKFGKARRSEKAIYQAEARRLKEMASGVLRQDPYQPGIASADGSLNVLRAHPLSEAQRANLAASGMAIIVFLPSLEEQAASVMVTHFHILPTEAEHQPTLVKVELIPAFHPAVVLPFDNASVKDRALAQLRHSSRFNFLEEQGVRLNAYTLREGVAQEPTFKLGSVPLKNLVLLDESLRAFFWYKGYIPKRDLITEYIRGVTKSNVVARNNHCLAWVQKCTVVQDGNGDQKIPAELVETCSVCAPSRSRQQLMVKSDVSNSPEIPRQIPKFPDHLRTCPKPSPMSRDKVGSVAAPPAPTSSNMAKKDMDGPRDKPDHGPESHCPASTAVTQPIIPASYVANDNRRHQSNLATHRQGRSQNALATPARPSNVISGIRAPDRKVLF